VILFAANLWHRGPERRRTALGDARQAKCHLPGSAIRATLPRDIPIAFILIARRRARGAGQHRPYRVCGHDFAGGRGSQDTRDPGQYAQGVIDVSRAASDLVAQRVPCALTNRPRSNKKALKDGAAFAYPGLTGNTFAALARWC